MSQKIFYNKTINKKELKTIIHSTFESYGIVKATKLVENFKNSGFTFATKAGISISVEDLKVSPRKDSLFLQSNEEIKLAYFYEKRGNINEIERFQKVIDTWHNTSESLKNQLVDFFKTIDPLNPVYMMAFSGARGNLSQVRQLVGMRGLMADPNGQIIDLPIKANFREGLTITDYVISSYGARKGIVDTALKTADSGYLTRRLVDVAQHVIIRELDCETKNGIRLSLSNSLDQKKIEKLVGRILAKDIIDPIEKKIVVKKGTLLTITELKKINFLTNIIVRSPLICESSQSICQTCYGWNLAQSKLVELADAVGVIAAQSIGEPGTQLTMRTFHTGGVFTGESSNQIRSTENGIVLFNKDLKTTISRTIYGEIILSTENNSQIYILTNDKKLIKIKTSPKMLLFVRNQSEVKKGNLIAEIPNISKQTTKEIKNIASPTEGEIQLQNIVLGQRDSSTLNGLLWIATGQVYDIYENMLIKRSKQTIIKNNSITQTKISTPISGFIKLKQRNDYKDVSIIHKLMLFSNSLIYKKNKKILLCFGKKYLFQLSENKKQTQSLSIQKYLATQVKPTYTLPISYKFFTGAEKYNLYLLNPLYSEKFFTKRRNLIFELEKNDETFDKRIWDKRILFPGETIIKKIKIEQLSYCKIIELNEKKLIIQINPLTQCVISKPSNYILKQNKIANIKNVAGFTIKLNAIEGETINANKSFISNKLIFSGVKNINGFYITQKLLKHDKKNSQILSYFLTYHFPIKFTESNINILNSKINYNITENQYIEKYATIATISNTVAKKTNIKAIKNSKQRPSRLLISDNTNYKKYNVDSDSTIKDQKFVLIDDKINSKQLAGYSGYKIDTDKGLTIRISIPFFISIGTRIFVQHGSLINKGEALCQLIYNRVISNDIITGLPRIENLFEARIDKSPGQLIENPGIIREKIEKNGKLFVLEKQRLRTYDLHAQNVQFLMKKGEIVFVGQPINTNSINTHNVLATYFKYYCSFYTAKRATLLSVSNIQILLVKLIQEVYQSQGVSIADKHIEIIIRQITSKVKILRFNLDTFFIPTEFMEFDQVNYINNSLKLFKNSLIEYQPVLLGITKVSLMTESFISAASFQETTRILAQAAVEGRIEWLRGLKENVILGRLIPAGTGFKSFNSTSLLNVRFNS